MTDKSKIYKFEYPYTEMMTHIKEIDKRMGDIREFAQSMLVYTGEISEIAREKGIKLNPFRNGLLDIVNATQGRGE